MTIRALKGENMVDLGMEYGISPVTVRRKAQDLINKVSNPVAGPGKWLEERDVVHISIEEARKNKCQLILKVRRLTAEDYQWRKAPGKRHMYKSKVLHRIVE